ncbi:GNAT family N-acetyltransferase [Vibrio parahaemolyticus]|uniref:GNAT family N-acetyltransferase n=4 Tax=Vibrio parahaemolyticus TaxID=670 RepID=UPI00111CED9D|nr:GNAT family N-acetyltransferase [Vibrio parahaemolyticus]ELA8088818.1 GNAT family N-acetyltransferase [Vibrio parahaemolyticus]ELA8205925.1 GNAT family N-acetyltransferase [Vibrio parahaemolyticus]ELB2030845.1 GNAT family N-acetyltransferase [Vibrio parahaemolyticus]ELB2142130.1 GNAT family N-acetyltransferase [Vibrio parahaemolyticus]ELB2219894.1 GNAT family N-acetyltransferase [Vibrio parahaemolyticus]
MRIFEADSSMKDAVGKFYKEQGYHSAWSNTERAFICLNDGAIIGSVKVELINDVTILRGMYIASEFQGQGLGLQFLKHIEPVLNLRTAYCMPLAHVTDFYKHIGFNEVEESQYPEFLQQRCEKYREMGYSITTMRRKKFA